MAIQKSSSTRTTTSSTRSSRPAAKPSSPAKPAAKPASKPSERFTVSSESRQSPSVARGAQAMMTGLQGAYSLSAPKPMADSHRVSQPASPKPVSDAAPNLPQAAAPSPAKPAEARPTTPGPKPMDDNYRPYATAPASAPDSARPEQAATPAGQPPEAPKTAPVEASAERPRTRGEVVDLANEVSNQVLKQEKQGTPPSQTVQDLVKEHGAPPKLGKVLTVHGLFSGPGAFKTMTDYWTHGGRNQLAGTIDGKRLNEMGLTPDKIRQMNPQQLQETAKKLGLNPQGNIFNMEFAQNASQTDTNKAQLAAASELVRRLGDGGKFDVVAHSKGGIDTRNLLADGNDNIRSLTTLGTPHKGSWVADVGKERGWARDAVRYFMGTERTQKDAPALQELATDSNATQRLLKGWEGQRERLQRTFHIAGVAAPLIGDSVVSHDSARLPGSKQRTIYGADHQGLTSSPVAVAEVTKFLEGRPMSQDGDLYENGKIGTAYWAAGKVQEGASAAIDKLRSIFR
jgi:hypothetical protein